MNKLKVGDKVRFRPHVIEFHVKHPNIFKFKGKLDPNYVEEYCMWLMANQEKNRGLEGTVIGFGMYDTDDHDKKYVKVKYKLKKYNLGGQSFYSESDLIKIRK